MNQTSIDSLVLGHPALVGLPPPLAERLQSEVTLRRYEVGQALCLDQQLPSELLLIVEGTARLMVRDQGQHRSGDPGQAQKIGLHHGLPILVLASCDCIQAVSPAGIVDEHIHPGRDRLQPLAEGVHRSGGGNIEFMELRPGPGFAANFGHLRQAVQAAGPQCQTTAGAWRMTHFIFPSRPFDRSVV